MRKITATVLFAAIVIYIIATGTLAEEIVFAKMHTHPLGKVDSYEEYEIVPLGNRLCFLKQGDQVKVADIPGKGKGYYYEDVPCSWSNEELVPIGVSRNYIIMEDKDEIRYGVQHDRGYHGAIIDDWYTCMPYYTLKPWDHIIITP